MRDAIFQAISIRVEAPRLVYMAIAQRLHSYSSLVAELFYSDDIDMFIQPEQ